MGKGKIVARSGRGFIRIFPVEGLFRSARGLQKGATVARRPSSVQGIGRGRQAIRTVSQRRAWRKAAQERDKLHADLVRQAWRRKDGSLRTRAEAEQALKRMKAKTVTGVTDPETGLTAAGRSRPEGGAWGCAERDALDNLNALRKKHKLPPLEPHQVDYSTAATTTLDGPPGKQMPICEDFCQARTFPEQFPNNVQYFSPGPWDDLLIHGRRGG